MESRPSREAQPLPDYYKTLQIDPSAEPAVIEAVYQALARRYDPTTNPDPDAQARLAEIQAAYEVLSDPRKRETYDLARLLARRVAELEVLQRTQADDERGLLAPRPSDGTGPTRERQSSRGGPSSPRPSPPGRGSLLPPLPLGEAGLPPARPAGGTEYPTGALAADEAGEATPTGGQSEAPEEPAKAPGAPAAALPEPGADEADTAAEPPDVSPSPPGPAPLRSPSSLLFALVRAHPEGSAVAGLVLLALAVRLVGLATVPPNVTADEADNLQVVYHIFAGKGAPGPFGLDWKPAPAFSVYLMAAFMSVFGWSIVGMRMASVVLTSLSIVPFYYVARERLSVAASLASAFLLSTGLWYLHFSRSGWENAQAGLFTMLAAWGLIRGLQGRGLRYYAVAGAACALGLYGYFSGRFIVVSLLAYLPFALWERRGRAREVLAGYAVLLLVCAALFAPQARTILQNWEHFNGRTRTVAITSAQLPYQGARTLPELVAAQLGRTARAFVFLDGTVINNARYYPVGQPIFDPLTGALFLVGIGSAAFAVRRTALWWCLAAVPIGLIQVASMGTPDLARAVSAAPALYLFVGYGFDRLAPRPGSPRRALQLAAVLLLPWAAYQNLSDYAGWMAKPDTASTRAPAVEVAEFDLWQSLQYRDALAGEWGFTAGQWADMRRQLGLPAIASAPAEPARSLALQTAAPQVGRFQATLGADLLREPRGVAVGPDGSVYVADAGRRQVMKLDATGGQALTWGQEGQGDGEFVVPWDVAVDDAGRVYVLDSDAQLVQRFDSAGRFQARLLEKAGFYHPRGLAVDATGAVYVADTGRNRIVKMSPGGEIAAIFGVGGNDAKLEQPTDVVVDGDGNLYVAEPAAQRLQKLAPDGRPLAAWGIPSSDTLNAPHLAMLGARLLVTNPRLQRVDVYTPDGTLVGQLGAPGSGDGQFAVPVGLAASAGRVYVADPRQARVEVFDLGEQAGAGLLPHSFAFRAGGEGR